MLKANFQTETINGRVKVNYNNVIQINISNLSSTISCKMSINGIMREIPVVDDSLPISDWQLVTSNHAFDIEIEFLQAENVIVDYFTVIPKTPNSCE